MRHEFKVGDRVRHEGIGEGVIKYVDSCDCAVEFDNFHGHWCGGYVPSGRGWLCNDSELSLVEPSNSFIKKGKSMIKDLFKSKKQKLFEKYVFNGEGINFHSEVFQTVLLQTLEKDLLKACEEAEAAEKEANKSK